MLNKVKRIVHRLQHPLFWSRDIIMGVLATQISLVSLSVLWIISFTKIPEKSYVKKTLDARRDLIKNLKLANIESYIWEPVLNCENILSVDHYKKHKLNKSENEHCIPISVKFSKKKQGIHNKYITDQLKNMVTYTEKVEKPCLICHRNRSKYIVSWNYHISPQTSYHLNATGDDKIVEKSIMVGLGLIFTFWFIYSIVRFIMYNRGKLNILALAFVHEYQRFPSKPLAKMGFTKSYFLYAELGDHFLRGYMPQSTFLKWLELLIQKKTLQDSNHLFSHIKGSIIQANHHNNFEGIRLAQVIAKKAEIGRIIFERAILPDTKPKIFASGNSKKLIWKVRRSQNVEPEIYQFIDLKFDSITDLVDIRSLTIKKGGNDA